MASKPYLFVSCSSNTKLVILGSICTIEVDFILHIFLMLTDILVQYGFSLKEAEIYLANLSMGSSPASSIARKVNENRVTAYSILKKLVSEGIAHTVTKKNTTFYTVISPEQLLKNLEEKYAKFKEKLPELNAIASIG